MKKLNEEFKEDSEVDVLGDMVTEFLEKIKNHCTPDNRTSVLVLMCNNGKDPAHAGIGNIDSMAISLAGLAGDNDLAPALSMCMELLVQMANYNVGKNE